jgi:cytochrome c peroxidase
VLRAGFSLLLVLVVSTCAMPRRGKEEVFSKTDLGKKIFFDPILSKDKTIFCASCHKPQFAYADSTRLSPGVGGKLGARNTPSVMNMASREAFFWDGRAATLEEQARVPIENSLEMNMHFGKAVKRVAMNKEYKRLFLKFYNQLPNEKNIANALAEFQRSLESDGSAPHDLWIGEIDTKALNPSQLRGREIFLNKGKCFDCHFSPDFTGDEYRNIGLYDGQELNDKGRFMVSQKPEDLGKFKVPGLRNVELTAPYMHNGMFASLAEVIDFIVIPPIL